MNIHRAFVLLWSILFFVFVFVVKDILRAAAGVSTSAFLFIATIATVLQK